MTFYGGPEAGKYPSFAYQISAPKSPNEYQISSPLPPQFPPCRENRLVNRIYETIAQRGLNRNAPDGIEALFNDRLDLVRSRIELLLLLLDQRKEINERILHKIDEDSCKAQTLIFEMGPRAYRMDRERLSLERMKLDLEQQKRREMADYFRDIGMINKDLKDALIQYLGETQKRSVINTEGRL